MWLRRVVHGLVEEFELPIYGSVQRHCEGVGDLRNEYRECALNYIDEVGTPKIYFNSDYVWFIVRSFSRDKVPKP